ncbi:MAG: TolC family protein, partial [Planctomycetota bacterium]|nr:TolC family protein [Planctomycetota bacterium]
NRTPVIMARIGTDQEIADLEAILQNMLCNVEIRYWDLHCAYRAYEAARQGEDSALATWSLVNNKFQAGEGEPNEAAQTREQYFSFRSAKNQALADLLDAETNLRWLMGLANSDKRMVRPVDEPASVLVEYDWWHIYDEALTRRPELRKERWELKKRDLALAYARNGLLPQMDVVALYRVLGLGQKLAGGSSSSPEFPNWGSRAYDQLEDFDYNELSLQLEFGMPVGFRRELANVRNAQLKLAREHARLEDMELDAQRELAMVFRAKDTNYELAQDHANRWVASAEEERIQNARWKEGKTTIDRVLDARRRKAQSQIDYYRSLCEYNKSIALLQRRKGTMLEYCGVEFDEGPWPAKAYSDAADTARRRSATRTLHHGYTRPGVVSHTTMPETDSEGMLMQEGIDVEPGTALELIEPMPLETEIPIPMPQQLELEDQASRLPFPKSLRRRNSIPRADRLVQQASWEEQGGEYAPANDLRTAN